MESIGEGAPAGGGRDLDRHILGGTRVDTDLQGPRERRVEKGEKKGWCLDRERDIS